MRTAQYDARRKRRDDEDDPDNDVDDHHRVVPDGHSVRTPMLAMDARLPVKWIRPLDANDPRRLAYDARNLNVRDHQPHYVDVQTPAVLDAKRKATQARDSWVRSKVEAWRGTTAPPITTTPVGVSDARAQAVQSRLDRIRRMNDAWRTRDNYLQPEKPARARGPTRYFRSSAPCPSG
jgi:hypothetical protein